MAIKIKERATTYLKPEVLKTLELIKEQERFKNVSAVIEEAVNFYLSYRVVDSEKEFLSEGVKGAVQEALAKTDNRMGSNLFKISVELGVMQHLLALTLDVTDEKLRKLRGVVVNQVKKSKGVVKLAEVIQFQVRDEGKEEEKEEEEEEEEGGKDFYRPAYQKLLSTLTSEDTIVVKSIDRLGRNYDEILEPGYERN